MDELNLLRQLSELSSRLWAARDLETGLHEMLSATMELLHADMGNIQMLERDRRVLRIAVQQGFKKDFLDFFCEVTVADESACGRAFRDGKQTLIEDVELEPTFAPFRDVAKAAGFRAVQSTPLVAGDGCVLGVISTHFRAPRELTQKELQCLGLYARQAADFIERAHLDAAFRKSELRFRRSFESNMTAMGVWDTSGAIVDANDALLRLLGYKLSEVRAGKLRWDEITPSEWCEADEKALAEFREKGFCTPFEKAYRHKDGHLVPVIVGGALFEDDSEQGIFFALDLTAHKRAECALKEANHRKDEFLAVLAHELRNPLAPIHNGIQILLRAEKAAPRDHYANLLEMMERQVNQLVRLVDELMEVSRIREGKIRLNKEPTDIAMIVHNALETSKISIESGAHQVTLRLTSEPLTVFGDPLRLAQALTNLINNAAKYTPPKGLIEITSKRENGEAVIAIRDNGIGLAHQDLQRIFGLFAQIGGPVLAHGGLGIGLSLVRGLVELHGGKVEAQSEGAGKGSIFVVRLPLDQSHSPTLDKAAPKRFEPNGARTLVVDDNKDVADSFGMLLESLGTAVRVVYDGLSGIEEAALFKPDVIFLDIGMPQIDGYETARRIRASSTGQSATLVALTGWGQEKDRGKTCEAGFDFHLTKPASVEAVEEILSARPCRN